MRNDINDDDDYNYNDNNKNNNNNNTDNYNNNNNCKPQPPHSSNHAAKTGVSNDHVATEGNLKPLRARQSHGCSQKSRIFENPGVHMDHILILSLTLLPHQVITGFPLTIGYIRHPAASSRHKAQEKTKLHLGNHPTPHALSHFLVLATTLCLILHLHYFTYITDSSGKPISSNNHPWLPGGPCCHHLFQLPL